METQEPSLFSTNSEVWVYYWWVWGFFMINCATKLTADVTQSYLNEMLLAVFDYGVVNSFKILQRKKEAAS